MSSHPVIAPDAVVAGAGPPGPASVPPPRLIDGWISVRELAPWAAEYDSLGPGTYPAADFIEWLAQSVPPAQPYRRRRRAAHEPAATAR